jgi:hypothetical protein
VSAREKKIQQAIVSGKFVRGLGELNCSISIS